jgi:glyoxylase-like metal-dependent hydrolase (beta-lactamase superfamily II)
MKNFIELALAALLLMSPSQVSAAPAARHTPAVKLYTLDCGRIDIADMDAFADDGSYKGVSGQMVVPCYLIRSAKGDLLWDTGIGDQFYGPRGVTLLPGYVAHVPVKLRDQLKRLGLNFTSIEYLAFSHEHVDHIGNANAFSHAIWLLNRREHRWTIAHDGHDGQPPKLLAASTRARVRYIDGNYDVFGDGTVTIIQAPGHTPGHQVLLVKPTGQQPVLIAGDLWHSRSNYAHNRVPRINWSRTATLQSFRKVRAIAKQEHARILIEHAPEDFHPGLYGEQRAANVGQSGPPQTSLERRRGVAHPITEAEPESCPQIQCSRGSFKQAVANAH